MNAEIASIIASSYSLNERQVCDILTALSGPHASEIIDKSRSAWSRMERMGADRFVVPCTDGVHGFIATYPGLRSDVFSTKINALDSLRRSHELCAAIIAIADYTPDQRAAFLNPS